MTNQQTFLIFGATGQTGQHFVSIVLEQGQKVRAFVRNPAKLTIKNPDLKLYQGTIAEVENLDDMLTGVDFVVYMLGDTKLQKHNKINTEFVKKLIPAMRRQGVKRFLYQAGGLSKAPHKHLSPPLWIIRHTLARGYDGQHRDNEAVMEYLDTEAADIEWIVHRAGIGGNGPSKGVLVRSKKRPSIATFMDCAMYNYHALHDADAIHTCDFSSYQKV